MKLAVIKTFHLRYLRSTSCYYLEVISYLTKAVARGKRAELAGARAARRHVEFLDAATLPTLERRDKVQFVTDENDVGLEEEYCHHD